VTLARLTEVLTPAVASGVGLGAFNVFSIEHAEALTAAAEAAGTPVVLQISQNAVRYHGSLAPFELATLALARTPQVPELSLTRRGPLLRQPGLDASAVAVGTSHAMTERHVTLDLELISALRAAVPVPLVLHGSSGVPDQELVRAVEAGMTKINIATHLNHVFTNAVRDVLAANPAMVDSRRYLGPARDAVTAEAARLLRMFREL
jgi:fructose/tagatose bisphosphate aldolase